MTLSKTFTASFLQRIYETNGSKRLDITGLEGSDHFCKGLGIITSVIGYYA